MIKIQERPTVKCPGITSLFISFTFNKMVVDEIKLFDITFYNSDTKEWELPITDLRKIIDTLTNYDVITLSLMDDSQPEPFNYDLSDNKTKPFKHQEEAIQYGLQYNHRNWLLLDAPGLGKTLSLTILAKELKERYGLEHCLVVCGINTLKMNWKNEIEKHSDLSCRILGQRITRKGRLVVDGIPKRLEQLQNPIDEFFVVTNIETLREDKIVKAILKNKHNKFDMMVVDEIHTCKNSGSAQGKNLLKLNKSLNKIGATGTLLLNNPIDCFVPLKWIGAEHSNLSTFKKHYCVMGGFNNTDIVGFKNIDYLKYHLENYSLRRTKDILGLPEKTIIPEYLEMSDAQQTFYENIQQGVLDQIDKVKIRNNASLLSLITRFRQATACPSILTTEDIPSVKIDRAVELAEQLVGIGEKVVIFSTFKETVYTINKRLQNYAPLVATGDYDDEEIEEAKQIFQEYPDRKLFIGTWQKCGTGITLNAASYMIFIDTPWTAAVFEQAQDRIHRIGTKKPVFIYNLIAKDTIDERVKEIVDDKESISNYIIDDEITEKGIDILRRYIEDLI